MKMKITFLAILLLSGAVRLLAQPGSLDNSFGNGTGHVATLVGSTGCGTEAVAIQSNGKIVVAGYYTPGHTPQSNFAVVRYNYDGTLDNSFAGNGKLGIAFSGNDFASAVMVQPDKKILLAGYSNGYCALARVTTDGVLDNNFGTGGKKVLTGFGSNMTIRSTTLTATRQILITNIAPNGYNYFVARLNTNGSPDNSFGTGGLTITTLAYSLYPSPGSVAMVLQPDGKPVLAGTVYTGTSTDHHTSAVVLRYTTTGVLDPMFAGTGYEYVTAGERQDAEAYSVTIDP